MSWYNPNTWSPDGKAVFVNILIGVVITASSCCVSGRKSEGILTEMTEICGGRGRH